MENQLFPMNTEAICWYVAFGLGIILFLYGIIYLILKKGIKEEYFAKAAVFEFIASWILYMPEEFFNDIPDSLPALRIIESVFTALLRTFNIYLGNGYERVAFIGHPIFSSVYATLMTIANIVMLLFVAGFIIKFFEGPLQRVRLSFFKKRYTYIFPVCNEKTLAIASSTESDKKNLVFACAEKELDPHMKEKIDSIKGIYIEGTVAEVVKKVVKRSKGIEIFLFDNTEEKNLIELEEICRSLGNNKDAKVKIYVELSDTPWSLYDDFLKNHNSPDGDKLVVNFIRSEENFAYNNLLKNSIFENAILDMNTSNLRNINFLIVSMNERNLEMFKAILHLAQMPGYRLTVMVVDDQCSKSVLKQKFPEIYDECDKEGDAVYKILYKEKVDFESAVFDSVIADEFADLTFAFINAGSDLLNVNLAMRINAICHRNKRNNNYKIQVNIENRNICDKWNPDLMEHLDIVGDIASTYSYSFITMSDIEKGTIAIHKVRYNKDGAPTWISYCNNEYNRHSVYARTLSFKYKVWIIDEFYGADYSLTSNDRIWKIYEHMRWNMYTRSLGYVRAEKGLLNEDGKVDKKTQRTAKIHHDLVDYKDLSLEEQNKDALKLIPGIVDILKGI